MASQRQIQSTDQKTEQVSIPPHSTEAEQAVLGGIMLSNQYWDGIAAIITLSHSGRTPLLMSRISSGLPIFALSRVQETLNRCALYRGVTPVHFDGESRTSAGAKAAINLLKEKGYLVSGDIVLLTQGDESAGTTNVCRTLIVE